jgi:glutathione reductase (NADPH)
MVSKGIEGDTRFVWPEAMRFKHSFVDQVPERRERGMKKRGIVPIHGRAQFVDSRTIKVGEEILTANHFLIAAGAKPAELPIDGFHHLITSTEFLTLKELPARVIFVGGGYISFEFAFLSRLAGAEVQVLHRGERPLEGFDVDLVEILLKRASELGIDIRVGAEVVSVKENGSGYAVETTLDGKTTTFPGDLIVHGAGRAPDIDDMNLEAGGIDRNRQGVVVNEFLQSATNPIVYAAGDAAASGGKPLTPVAGFESHIVASNLLNRNRRKAEYPAQPTVVFTVPPLAAVGMTEKESKDRGFEVAVKFQETDSWYSFKRTNEKYTASKTIVDKTNGQILGAHLLGSKAEEVINIFAMAINNKLSVEDLKNTIYAYPSHSSDIPYML